MPATKSSINNQEGDDFDDFIILLALNIKKGLGFSFVGDENSRERQCADYLEMDIQKRQKNYQSAEDRKKNAYYNSFQTNLKKQIKTKIELADNTLLQSSFKNSTIKKNAPTVLTAAGLGCIAYPTLVPATATMAIAGLCYAAGKLIYTNIKRQEAILVKKYLIERNQPIIELVISLFTLYSVEKLSGALHRKYVSDISLGTRRFSELIKTLKNILNNKSPLDDLDDDLKAIYAMANKDSTLLMENLVKHEKNMNIPPHMIYDSLTPEFFKNPEFLKKNQSLKRWLGALEKTMYKETETQEWEIFENKLPELYQITATAMMDRNNLLEQKPSDIEKQNSGRVPYYMDEQASECNKSRQTPPYQASHRKTASHNQKHFFHPQNYRPVLEEEQTSDEEEQTSEWDSGQKISDRRAPHAGTASYNQEYFFHPQNYRGALEEEQISDEEEQTSEWNNSRQRISDRRAPRAGAASYNQACLSHSQNYLRMLEEEQASNSNNSGQRIPRPQPPYGGSGSYNEKLFSRATNSLASGPAVRVSRNQNDRDSQSESYLINKSTKWKF